MKQSPDRLPRLLFLALSALLFPGCVGPTSPLGAIDHPLAGSQAAATAPEAETPAEESPATPAETSSQATIRFSPGHQQVHGPYTWQVQILDPAEASPDPSQVRVFYNDLEVTAAAASQFEVHRESVELDGHPTLQLAMPHLRLEPLEDHRIRVEYTTGTGERIAAAYQFPILTDLGSREPLGTTEPFHIAPELLGAIERASNEFGVNPVVLAALIAQESSFDPAALSRARALGLTQVTHGTEPDIARHFPEWPRNPSLGRFSRRELSRLIPEVINRTNEWRLDPEKSVRGGAYYLGYLRDRLLAEANRRYLEAAGPDREGIAAEASLAAYNSGLNRILYMMKTHGPEWLEQRRTREAKRYVRKILSYYGAFRKESDGLTTAGEAT